MNRSSYTYTIDGDVLFLEDLNVPLCKSLTNDIDNVIDDLTEQLKTSMDNFKIIYRDSDGTIDGITTDKGAFDNFYHIGETSYHAAKLKIK